MTAQNFVSTLIGFFGEWKEPRSRPAVGATVRVWANSKSGEYLDAMWEVLRAGRDPVRDGPPSINILMQFADDAKHKMLLKQKPAWETFKRGAPPVKGEITQEVIDSWPTVEDAPGDGWLSREDAKKALGVIMARLEAKRLPGANA